MKKYLPVEYDVSGRPAAIVGADELVASKIDRLLQAGAVVTVYACDAPPSAAVRARAVAIEPGAPEPSALSSAAVVFVSPAFADRVDFRPARDAGRLWCTLDRPEQSTFVNPAVVDAQGIGLRFVTGGASPALLRRLREDLEGLLSAPELTRFVDRLAGVRATLPRGQRGDRMRAAVRGFALKGQILFPRWFVEGTEPPGE
jgi:precorrin-2 dehydrogenase/sirohydrochlorin ferrochelatase